MKVGTLSRGLGQIGRVNHCLGDFLLARHNHVGAEAPQVLDLRIAVGARKNADAGVEPAGDRDNPGGLETIRHGDMDQLCRFGGPGFHHVDGDGGARNCR